VELLVDEGGEELVVVLHVPGVQRQHRMTVRDRVLVDDELTRVDVRLERVALHQAHELVARALLYGGAVRERDAAPERRCAAGAVRALRPCPALRLTAACHTKHSHESGEHTDAPLEAAPARIPEPEHR
jgi:hypothetical protein